MKRVDGNQKEIVRVLRQAGASVQHLSEVGQGCPDLLVGFRQRNYLLEVKDGSKPPSARKLTEDEQNWHAKWRGQVSLVRNFDEALQVIGFYGTSVTE